MTKKEIIDNIARLGSQTWRDREEVRTEIGKLLSEYMQIDSNNLIRKLPAMIQGRRKFAKTADGGNYHIGAVDDWCLTYKEVVQAIEDYCEYRDTGKYRLSAPINGSWNVMNAYPYKESDAEG